MPERLRVYHPETDEPFDIPVATAQDLVLNKGWRQQPLNPQAEPHVQTVESEHGIDTISDDTEMEDWRDDEIGREIIDVPPVRRRRKRN